MRYRLGELFCGPGGMALGAHLADIGSGDRIIHQWASDYDEVTCQTYLQNIPGASTDSVICADVRELDFTRLSPIDGLAFGFPCNDYSLAGKQKGLDGSFGPLYIYGVKALEHFRPAWFVAENVSGLSSANSGQAFTQILSDLGGVGYRLVTNLYKFEQYGVPQNRHRYLIVGIREDLNVQFRVPSVLPYRDADVSARNALTCPPIDSHAANHELPRHSGEVVERLRLIKPGQNAWTTDLPPHLRLKTKGVKLSQIYKRLDPDKPAYTVTGSGGGGTSMYHFDYPRALTNRERARLQTFPDDFVFAGSKNQVRKQIGMAVPPAGARVVFEALMRCFAGAEYEWQRSSA